MGYYAFVEIVSLPVKILGSFSFCSFFPCPLCFVHYHEYEPTAYAATIVEYQKVLRWGLYIYRSPFTTNITTFFAAVNTLQMPQLFYLLSYIPIRTGAAGGDEAITLKQGFSQQNNRVL